MSTGLERPSLWLPITDPVDLAHLGKLLEEIGELTAIVSRCIIQGITEADPESGKPNRETLTEEIADVLALSSLVVERFALDGRLINERRRRKESGESAWFQLLLHDSP